MKAFVFLHPQALALFGLVPLILVLHFYESLNKSKSWQSFLCPTGGGEESSRRVFLNQMVDRLGFVFGMLGLLTALGGPAWRSEQSRTFLEGRDIVAVLDVSRSMAAEDLPPNRLQWAKALLRAWSKTHMTDRMGIVVFSERAAIRCPLTWDKNFFYSVLDEISIRPETSQGTELISGLEEAIRLVSSEKDLQRPRVVLVLTDGEDHGPDSRPIFRDRESMGLSWVLVGLGDPVRGARIPVQDVEGRRRFLRYQGAEVWSRMDRALLRNLADSSPRAVFIEAKGSPEDFARKIHEHLESVGVSPLNYGAAVSWREVFQIPLMLGIVFLIGDFCAPKKSFVNL